MPLLKVELIVGSDTIELTDQVSYALGGWEGLGLPPVERFSTRSPMQDGVTDLGFRLGPRKLRLKPDLIASDLDSHFTRRNALVGLMKPGVTPANLRVSYPTGKSRQLDVHAIGGLQFGSDGMEGFSQVDVVELFCPNPVWYDPTQKQTIWVVTGTSQLVFPITFSIQFIASAISQGQVVGYVGTWREYPQFILTGPMQNPIITNETLGKKIELVYDISLGETVTITLTPGNKSVVNNSGTNLIGSVSTDSDLPGFYLAPHPEAASGNNTIKLVAGGMTAGTSQVQMKYYDRFIGI